MIKLTLIFLTAEFFQIANKVLSIAKEVVQLEDVRVFRAGIWKPRTRPGNFEGVGALGLKWLQKA